MAFNMLDAMGVFNDAPNIPEIVMLDIDQLRDSEENFYFVEDEQSEKIRAKNEELKASIEMFGVLEPLLVKPIGGDEYDIVSGHRRRFVSSRIVTEGKEEYRKIPCIIDTGKLKEEYEAEFTDKVKAALMGIKLIQLNSTAREIDGWQQTEQVRRTKEKLLILKENGVKMPGGMRNQIVLLTGMNRSEVGRHEQIIKNLDEGFQEEYKSGNIVKHAAAELAAMPAEDQRAVYEQTGGKATVKDIKEYKAEQNQKELGISECANAVDDFWDEYGRMKANKYCRHQRYKEHDKTIDIKDNRLPDGGFRLYLVQDKEDGLWRSSAARGFIEAGGGRWPHRDADNPIHSKIDPVFQTMEEALKYASDNMFWHCNADQKEILKSWGYKDPAEREQQQVPRFTALEREQAKIDEWNRQMQEQRQAAKENEELAEQEAESACLIIEGDAKPRERKEVQSDTEPVPEPALLKIEAAKYTMGVLGLAADKCEIEIRYAEEQGKAAKGALATAKLEYLGGVLLKVQADLFEMTGDDMFKEK